MKKNWERYAPSTANHGILKQRQQRVQTSGAIHRKVPKKVLAALISVSCTDKHRELICYLGKVKGNTCFTSCMSMPVFVVCARVRICTCIFVARTLFVRAYVFENVPLLLAHARVEREREFTFADGTYLHPSKVCKFHRSTRINQYVSTFDIPTE